jgi:hypothetical protein
MILGFPKNGEVTVNNGNRTIRFGAFEADLPSWRVRPRSECRDRQNSALLWAIQPKIHPSLRPCHVVVTVLRQVGRMSGGYHPRLPAIHGVRPSRL